MPRQQTQKKPNRRTSRRILLEPLPAEALRTYWVIPTTWVNNFAGFFLLIPAWLLTQTFFCAFGQSLLQQFWRTDEFWFFSLGSVIWLLWFAASMWMFGEPRPIRVYVFGHELTHAVWVWIFGGSVSEFVASRDGGYIRTDKNNFLISLAPYFYPIYSLAVIVFYGVCSVFYDLARPQDIILGVGPLQILFFIVGFTWAFHLSFTVWMIPKGQTDLTRYGTFFSLVVIYAMNIVLLAVFLIIAAPEVSCRSFGAELLLNTENLCEKAWPRLVSLYRWFLPANSL